MIKGFQGFLQLLVTNWKDMVDSSGLKKTPARVLGYILFILPALVLTFSIKIFDKNIEKLGINAACGKLLTRFYLGVQLDGNIPETGALLILSNHPGLGDTLATVNQLKRKDIKIVAFNKTFFRCLPNLYAHIIPVEEKPEKGASNIRTILSMLSWLKSGGAVLLYPAGEIEPDPAFLFGRKKLKPWSKIAAYLAVKAEAQGFHFSIAPLEAGHVYTEKAFQMPFVQRRKTLGDSEKLAALWILLTGMNRKRNISVTLKGLTRSDILVQKNKETESIQNEILKFYQDQD